MLSLKDLEAGFLAACCEEVEKMLNNEYLSPQHCQEVYSKYQSIFLMLDMGSKIQRSLDGEDKELIQKLLNRIEK